MPKLIKFKSSARRWKLSREKDTWRRDKRRSLLLRPSWSRSSKMRWMPWRRSSRATWTRDWRSEKLIITSFSRDIRTSRRRSIINTRCNSSSLRSSTWMSPRWDHQLPPREAWWPPRWVPPPWEVAQECNNPRWAACQIKHTDSQPPSHLTWNEKGNQQRTPD